MKIDKSKLFFTAKEKSIDTGIIRFDDNPHNEIKTTLNV